MGRLWSMPNDHKRSAAPRELFAAGAGARGRNPREQHRYLNMDDLREHKKEALRRAA